MESSRLPTTVRPVAYDLILRTDLDANPPSFSGVLRTTLRVVQSTHLLVFHAGPALSLGSASVISTGLPHDPAQEAVHRSYDPLLERMTLHFTSKLEERTEVVFQIAFSGTLGKNTLGYYYSTASINGEAIRYSATLFEVCPAFALLTSHESRLMQQPTSARKAFPCWDEPALKATFTISMVSRPHLENLSNMPIKSQGPCPGTIAYSVGAQHGEWQLTQFQCSPPVS
jgi:aminopeptidase 2